MEQPPTSSLLGHRHFLPPTYSGFPCLGLTGYHHLFSQNVVERGDYFLISCFFCVAVDLLYLQAYLLVVGLTGSFVANDGPCGTSGFIGHRYRSNIAMSAFT